MEIFSHKSIPSVIVEFSVNLSGVTRILAKSDFGRSNGRWRMFAEAQKDFMCTHRASRPIRPPRNGCGACSCARRKIIRCVVTMTNRETSCFFSGTRGDDFVRCACWFFQAHYAFLHRWRQSSGQQTMWDGCFPRVAHAIQVEGSERDHGLWDEHQLLAPSLKAESRARSKPLGCRKAGRNY